MSKDCVVKHIGGWGIVTQVLHAGWGCYIMEDLVSHTKEFALSPEDCGNPLEWVREVLMSAVWKKMGLRRVLRMSQEVMCRQEVMAA